MAEKRGDTATATREESRSREEQQGRQGEQSRGCYLTGDSTSPARRGMPGQRALRSAEAVT